MMLELGHLETYDLLLQLAVSHPDRFKSKEVCRECKDSNCCRPWQRLGGRMCCERVCRDVMPQIEQDEIPASEWKTWDLPPSRDELRATPPQYPTVEYITVVQIQSTFSVQKYGTGSTGRLFTHSGRFWGTYDCGDHTEDPATDSDVGSKTLHHGYFKDTHKSLQTNSNAKGLYGGAADHVRYIKRLWETVCPGLLKKRIPRWPELSFKCAS